MSDRSKELAIIPAATGAIERKPTFRELFERLCQVTGSVSVQFSHPSRPDPWEVFIHFGDVFIHTNGSTSAEALLRAADHVSAASKRRR